MDEILIPGTGFIHSYNMLNLLHRAFNTNDRDFVRAWFPAFFGHYENEADVKEAFLHGEIEIEEGPNDGDAIFRYSLPSEL